MASRYQRKTLFQNAWFDPATLFTRQEIAQRTGISDDVLSFWIKRGLLISAEGGEGKGSHRRFSFSQINIAAVYGVFRDHFGANVGTLQSLAALFQGAVKEFESRTNVTPDEWITAARLGQELYDFRAGSEVLVRTHDFDDPGYDDLSVDERLAKRPAVSETEIIASFGKLNEDDRVWPSAVLKLAEALGPGRTQAATLARDILGCVLQPYGFGDPAWVICQADRGWRLVDTVEGLNFTGIREQLGPSILLPVGHIFRKVWGIPRWEELRNIKLAEECQKALDGLGISAKASPATEEDAFYVWVDAPRDRWEALEPVVRAHAHYYSFRDTAR